MANKLEKAVNVLVEEIMKSKNEINSAIEASEIKLLLKIEELNHRVKDLEGKNIVGGWRLRTRTIISLFSETSENLSPVSFCRELHRGLNVEIQVSDLNDIYTIRTKGDPIRVEFISYLKNFEVMKY